MRNQLSKLSCLLISILCIVITTSTLSAGFRKSDIQAVYILNIMEFTQWRIEKAERQICTTTNNDVQLNLQELREYYNQSKFSYSVIQLSASSPALSKCDVIFIDAEDKANIRQILFSVRGRGILTISNSNEFIEVGGIIGFIKDKDKIQFEVNYHSAQENQLTLSSQLYSIAKRVIK